MSCCNFAEHTELYRTATPFVGCIFYTPSPDYHDWWYRSGKHKARDAQIFLQSDSYLSIVCARMMTCSEFHTEDSQILDSSTQHFVPMPNWRPVFVHPCIRPLSLLSLLLCVHLFK